MARSPQRPFRSDHDHQCPLIASVLLSTTPRLWSPVGSDSGRHGRPNARLGGVVLVGYDHKRAGLVGGGGAE